MKVQAILIHSVILITHVDHLDQPNEIICLDGLTVESVDDK
jgi:hypothetical protein